MISISASRRAAAIAGALVLLSGMTVHAEAAHSPNAAAWDRLWRNDDPGAKTAFKAALAANPKDADALRGLGWVAYNADDKRAALQFWSRSIALTPGAWTTEALWPYVTELDRSVGAHALTESAAKAIVAAPGASDALKASATLLLAVAAERRGERASANFLRASLQYIRDWRVIGPFDNVSKSGFDKVFAPEQGIDLNGTVAGREGRQLKWRHLLLVGRAGDCAVGAALGDRDEDAYYAVSAIRAAADGTASLAFDPAGASKVYCNGRLVFSDDVYRKFEGDEDAFRISAPVRKGWNTLLIKLTDSRDQASSFRLRAVPNAGVAIDAVESGQASGAVETGASAAPASVAAWDVVTAHDSEIEGALALGYLLAARGDYEAAENVLRKAIAAHPSSGALHWELSQALTSDGQSDEARAERDTACGLNRGLALADLNEIQVDKSSLPAPEQLRLLKALSARFPVSGDILSGLGDAYEAAELSSDAQKANRRALALNADPDAIVAFAESLKEEDHKSEAMALIKTAVKAEPAEPALLSELADLLSDQGDAAPAIAIYRRLIDIQPERPFQWSSLASIYTDMGDHAKAIDALSKAITLQPQSPILYAQLGDALREAHRSKEALAAYQTAIDLAPEDADLRTKLQVLSGQKPALDLVAALPTPSLKAADASKTTASVTYLLDDGREVVYPDFATVAEYHIVLRINDSAGVKIFQTYPLERSTSQTRMSLEQARLIKADGKVENANREAEEGVAFPSLAVGDTIDISYREEDYQRGGLAHQFWGEWGFTNRLADKRVSRFALITPPGMQFQTRTHGDAPKPTERTVDGWRVQEWRMENAPEVKLEKEGAPGRDCTAWLDFSSIKDWATIVRWYQDLSQPRIVPDEAIKARAAELTKDAKTEDDKIRAIVGYVSRDIQYQSSPFRLSAFVPTEGKQVMREHYGDCKDKAALLTALLAAEGIHSEMVLLSPRDAGLTPFLPSPRFNHAIARIETANGPRFIDATADQLTYGDLPEPDQGTPVLLIDDHSSDLVKSPLLSTDANVIESDIKGKLDAAGAFEGDMTVTMRGNWAWVMRSALKDMPANKNDDMLRSMSNSMFSAYTYVSGSMEHAADTDSPLVLHFHCRAPHFAKPAGAFLIAPAPWTGAEKSGEADELLTNGVRTQDLETGIGRGVEKFSFALDLPSGFAPQDLQPSSQRDSKWGAFDFHYKMDGSTLRGDGTYTITPDRIAASDVPSFVELMRAVEDEIGKQIVLKKS